MDVVLTFRLLAELYQELNHSLHMAYIDIKAAFDSVNRSALWLALKGGGVPDVLLNLLTNLHIGTSARVSSGSWFLLHFYTTSRVQQGGTLTPTLFY